MLPTPGLLTLVSFVPQDTPSREISRAKLCPKRGRWMSLFSGQMPLSVIGASLLTFPAQRAGADGRTPGCRRRADQGLPWRESGHPD